MSLLEDYIKWVKRGRQRTAVVRVLRKPMTASEICRAAQPINPHIQLRDVWFIMGQLKQKGLVVCLNPKHVTGKLYSLTAFGHEVAVRGFNLPPSTKPEHLDWRRYAQVVRAKVRKLVLLELARLPSSSPRTASVIRRHLREKHPIGLNQTIRALKDLERLGLARSKPVSDRDARRAYRATTAGLAVARQLAM